MTHRKEELQRIAHEFHHGRPDGVDFNLVIRVDFANFRRFSDEQVLAFMNGIAEVIKAQAATSPVNQEGE